MERSFELFESISNNNVTSNTWQMHINIWHDLIIVKVWYRYHVRVGNSRRVCDVRRHQCHWGTRSRYGSCSHLWDRDSTRPNYSENVWDALIRSVYSVRTFLHFLCRLPEQLNPSLPVTKDWDRREKTHVYIIMWKSNDSAGHYLKQISTLATIFFTNQARSQGGGLWAAVDFNKFIGKYLS